MLGGKVIGRKRGCEDGYESQGGRAQGEREGKEEDGGRKREAKAFVRGR
jgi:hypothetical protein